MRVYKLEKDEKRRQDECHEFKKALAALNEISETVISRVKYAEDAIVKLFRQKQGILFS